jgi:hypothetical protein
VLDGINKKIQADEICQTDGTLCKSVDELLITGAVGPQ